MAFPNDPLLHRISELSTLESPQKRKRNLHPSFLNSIPDTFNHHNSQKFLQNKKDALAEIFALENSRKFLSQKKKALEEIFKKESTRLFLKLKEDALKEITFEKHSNDSSKFLKKKKAALEEMRLGDAGDVNFGKQTLHSRRSYSEISLNFVIRTLLLTKNLRRVRSTGDLKAFRDLSD